MRTISFNKNALDRAILLLRAHEQYDIAYAIEEAINEHDFDESHRLFQFELVNVPTLIERAVSASCTTDCVKFCDGSCPFYSYSEMERKCYRIQFFIQKESNDIDFNS